MWTSPLLLPSLHRVPLLLPPPLPLLVLPLRPLLLRHRLALHLPRHRLLLSDFASLPDTVPGVCGPVVQTRVRGTTVPCETLLVKQGFFDIFFPTDFPKLRDMYEHVLAETPPRALGRDPRITPFSASGDALALGAGFFSSYHPKDRRPWVDGLPSASGLPVGERKSQVFTHAEFMETYADLEETRLQNGENPMVDYYQNVKFLF